METWSVPKCGLKIVRHHRTHGLSDQSLPTSSDCLAVAFVSKRSVGKMRFYNPTHRQFSYLFYIFVCLSQLIPEKRLLLYQKKSKWIKKEWRGLLRWWFSQNRVWLSFSTFEEIYMHYKAIILFLFVLHGVHIFITVWSRHSQNLVMVYYY